jgi:hypothetical protein
MATGFHGFHVFIGTIFLFICLLRLQRGHFTPERHIGFEAAAWYGTSLTLFGSSCLPQFTSGWLSLNDCGALRLETRAAKGQKPRRAGSISCALFHFLGLFAKC